MRRSVAQAVALTGALLVALAVTPGASAKGQTSGLAAAMASPCSMVTQDEAQALLGNTGMQPALTTLGIVPTCEYKDSGFTHEVDLAIFTSATAKSLAPPMAPPLSGLGFEVYCDPRTSRGGDQANLYAAIDANDALQVVEQQRFLTCDVAAQFAQKGLGRISGSLAAPPDATPPPVSGGVLDNAMAYRRAAPCQST